ncbi:Integrin [Salix suchowensis]|nr:Integrin [Salix suchowensis]
MLCSVIQCTLPQFQLIPFFFFLGINSSSFLRFSRRKYKHGKQAPSWADQWGSGSFSKEDDEKFTAKVGHNNGSNKMAEVKAAASTGLDKAKTAAQKVKSGTSVGIKWVKNQYQKKKTSK